MEKCFLTTFATLLFSFSFPPTTIYTVKVHDLNGRTLNLANCRGKKIVFIVLSGKEADSTLNQLSLFQNRYREGAVVIGILSREDGYDNADKENVKNVYKSKVQGILLTEGMYTRKSSAGQSDLMQWLTHKEQNLHFDREVAGRGQKFFIDEAGVLYGALGPKTTFASPIFERIMGKPARKLPPARTQSTEGN